MFDTRHFCIKDDYMFCTLKELPGKKTPMNTLIRYISYRRDVHWFAYFNNLITNKYHTFYGFFQRSQKTPLNEWYTWSMYKAEVFILNLYKNKNRKQWYIWNIYLKTSTMVFWKIRGLHALQGNVGNLV